MLEAKITTHLTTQIMECYVAPREGEMGSEGKSHGSRRQGGQGRGGQCEAAGPAGSFVVGRRDQKKLTEHGARGLSHLTFEE